MTTLRANHHLSPHMKAFVYLILWLCLSCAIFQFYDSNIESVTIQSEPNPWVLPPNTSSIGHIRDPNCKGFDDSPLHPSFAQYFERKSDINCQSGFPTLLFLENMTHLRINKTKAKMLKLSVDYCQYSSLKRKTGSDFHVDESKWSKSFTDSIAIPDGVEHIWGKCLHFGDVISNDYISVIQKNITKEKILIKRYENHLVKNKPKETLSVLLIGIDATSKNNFARQMPKTKQFVLEKMDAVEFFCLNKVGQNTLPNVLPLLTGRSEDEIRTNWTDKEYIDKIDHFFLWDEARLAGYRTSTMLDKNEITSFHYLKKGWKNPKFDFYNRPIVLSLEENELLNRRLKNCAGDVPEVTLFYDYWLQLTAVYNNSVKTPYFGYSFFCKVTHNDLNDASQMDGVYLKLFQTLQEQRSLNNTLVIFFSDHGSRYGEFRSTFRGMLEDNNPFMFFIFPPWFKAKYPKVMDNFQKNQHRLVTNFDVHATLKDILYFKGDDLITRKITQTRGISLFQELPERRTCEQAGIPLKFCNCRNTSIMSVDSKLSSKISQFFLMHINRMTSDTEGKCVVLELKSIVSVFSFFTTFHNGKYFQATIETSPGGAVYEATIEKPKTSSPAVVGDVQRINMYKGQADCMFDARIRPFCYCRDLL